MRANTYIFAAEKSKQGYKAQNRLILLLGGNAVGNLKLKPPLVYHNENSRAFKGTTEYLLLEMWKFCIFYPYFVPEIIIPKLI